MSVGNGLPSFGSPCDIWHHHSVLPFGDILANLVVPFTACGHQSSLWPKATIFERSQRHSLWPSATIIRYCHRPQQLKGPRYRARLAMLTTRFTRKTHCHYTWSHYACTNGHWDNNRPHTWAPQYHTGRPECPSQEYIQHSKWSVIGTEMVAPLQHSNRSTISCW